MAEKRSFPMLPGAHWWALREKFKQSIPGVVTDSYLATALNTKQMSARNNILPYIKDIGLIDPDGKTQDLARDWRDDQKYADVCKQIRESVYPEELRTAVTDPVKERDSVARWFANKTGAGASAVRRMTQFYLILAEADVQKKADPKGSKMLKIEKKGKKEKVIEKPREGVTSGSSERSSDAFNRSTSGLPSSHPGICINLQIHISADATPDQIDKIFESMAKHIYKKL